MSHDVRKSYDLLGVTPGSSFCKVRMAYEKRISQFPSAWIQEESPLESEEMERIQPLHQAFEKIEFFIRNKRQLSFPWEELQQN